MLLFTCNKNTLATMETGVIKQFLIAYFSLYKKDTRALMKFLLYQFSNLLKWNGIGHIQYLDVGAIIHFKSDQCAAQWYL